jgi:hypothetical protein
VTKEFCVYSNWKGEKLWTKNIYIELKNLKNNNL